MFVDLTHWLIKDKNGLKNLPTNQGVGSSNLSERARIQGLQQWGPFFARRSPVLRNGCTYCAAVEFASGHQFANQLKIQSDAGNDGDAH